VQVACRRISELVTPRLHHRNVVAHRGQDEQGAATIGNQGGEAHSTPPTVVLCTMEEPSGTVRTVFAGSTACPPHHTIVEWDADELLSIASPHVAPAFRAMVAKEVGFRGARRG